MPAVIMTTSLTGSAAGAASAALNCDLDFSITDWTAYLSAELSENVAVLLYLEDSCDDFVNDRHVLLSWCPQAGSGLINHVTLPNPLRRYQCPLARIGVTGANIRLFLASVGGISLGSVTAKLRLELNRVEY